jgi:hypothetical protein
MRLSSFLLTGYRRSKASTKPISRTFPIAVSDKKFSGKLEGGRHWTNCCAKSKKAFLFKRISIDGINPSTELSGIQSSNDISVSGENAIPGGTVQAADPASMDPPVPTQQPQGFGSLSVEQAVAAIEARAKRISIVRPRADDLFQVW